MSARPRQPCWKRSTNPMKEPSQRTLKVDERPINLTQVLKLAGCVQSGGEAKAVIAAGRVQVNGEVELRKRRQDEGRRYHRGRGGPTIVLDLREPPLNRAWPRRLSTQARLASELQPAGNSASSISMLGMSSLIENRGPHRVQINMSPSRRKGALPSGHTRSDSNASFTMGQILHSKCI